MGKPAARMGDMHICPKVTAKVPHVGGPVLGACVPAVLIGGQAAAVMGDMCICVGPPDKIASGSAGVLIGGKPAARMGDACEHGGKITTGLSSVLIGDDGGKGIVLAVPAAVNAVSIDDPKCKVTSLVIHKENSNRILRLDKKNPVQILEVVGGNLETIQKYLGYVSDFKPATIISKASFSKGPCQDKGSSSHSGNTYDVGFPITKKTDTELTFKAFSDWQLIPWTAIPHTYEVNFNTCSENLKAIVAVYPDIEAGFGCDYKVQNEEYESYRKDSVLVEEAEPKIKKIKRKNRKRKKTKELPQESVTYIEETHEREQVSKGCSLFGFYKFSNVEFKLSKVLKTTIETIKKIETIALPLIGLINQLKTEKGELQEKAKKINSQHPQNENTKSKDGKAIIFPNVSVRAACLWQEIENSTICAYDAMYSISCNPLFGLNFQYDITYAVLRATGLGNIVAGLKNSMESNGVKAIAVILSAGINATLEGKWEMQDTEVTKSTLKVEPFFPMKLEVVLVKTKTTVDIIFGFHADVEIDIGIKGETGISIKASAQFPSLFVTVEWLGLVITVASKSRFCFYRKVNNCSPAGSPTETTTTDGNVTSTKKMQSSKPKELQFTIPGKTIFGPWEFKI